MSDGGAKVIVDVVGGLAQFKVGRVVLWLAAAWLTLTSLTGRRDAGLWFFAALALALVALVAGFIAERRKRAERASLRNALAFLGLTVVTLVGGLWLVFRKKDEAVAAPPTEQEVDELVGS